MYDNIIKEIENYENVLKASITTNNTIMKLKNLKLEDIEKEITKARKDENVSNEELFSIYEKRDEIIKEIELEKAKIDFDNVKEEYNMLKERHIDLVKRYKEIESKKEKTTNEYILNELNNDAAYIIQSLESLTIPFSELNNRVNKESKEEPVKVEETQDVIESVEKEESKIISNDENQIKEKIQIVEENTGKQLKVVDFETNMKKFPKSFEDFMSRGGGEPDKDRPLRRIVKSIKNKWAEWKNKKAEVSEDELLKKEPSVIELAPIEVPNAQVSEDVLLKEETAIVDNNQKIDANSGIVANSIVPEEQLLNLQSEQAPNVLEEQPVIPMYEDSTKPDLSETQEMNLDQIYNPVNMQMYQGKSL